MELVKEQEYFLANEFDPDLMTIKIKTPSLVEWYAQFLGYTPTWEEAVKLVDGYDLPRKEQKFRYRQYPERLKNIASIIRRKRGKRKSTITTDDIYEELDANRTFYEKEIEYIKTDIKRRYHGYWFMNDGQPTYIDGWHYVYLNYWDIINFDHPNGCPEYRDVDRRLFLFARYCYTTTEAWYPFKVTYREKGIIKENYFSKSSKANDFALSRPNAIVEGGGGHEGFIKDFGRRTVYGFAHPKRRRRGATSAAVCIEYLIVIETKGRHGGMQSLNEKLAFDDVFADKLIRPWKKLPFYFKPAQDGSSSPKSKINFQYPADRTQMGAESRIDSHNGWIEPRAATERAFDGNMLHVILRDEGGKIDGYEYDLNEWWDVHKKCLAQGGGRKIHGFAMIPSTVGDMDSGGGLQYERFLLNSKWEERNANGQTITGNITYMEAAFDGLDGFIDEYGRSIIESPDRPMKNNNGEFIDIGAKEYLENQRRFYEQKGDVQGLINETRDFPFTLKEATAKGTRDSGFNLQILTRRIQELAYERSSPTRRVSLEWSTGERGSEVIVQDDENGRFCISYIPESSRRNQIEYDADLKTFRPALATCNRFIIGADPFAFNEEDVTGRVKSDGGIAVFFKRDSVIDPDDKPREEWVSNKFVCTYSQRLGDKDEYVDDVLKLCVLYGSFVFPETNVPLVVDKLKEWGFGGFLMYKTDEYGAPLPNAGQKSTIPVKEEIFSHTMTYIQNYGKYENHIELLRQWKDINGMEEMTKYDLFAAAGFCFLGLGSRYSSILSDNHQPFDFNEDDVLETF